MNCFPCRILVVEDEMMVLMLIEDMLSDLGCEAVTTAATVPQALTLIGAQVFDAAMLDMNLNGDKTTSVADALSARDVPFFFSTGYSGRDMRDGYRRVSERMCKQVSVSLPYRGDSHDDRHDDYT